MDDDTTNENTTNEDTGSRRRTARWTGALGLLAAGAVAGGVLAGTLSASAASGTTTNPSPGSSSTAQPPRGNFPPHGTAAHEDQEKPVTGANASKAQAAAVKAVGSGTAGAVTTDCSGKGYEVTVTKTDGTSVEVHLDSSFKAMQHRGPGGPGGHDGAGMPGGYGAPGGNGG